MMKIKQPLLVLALTALLAAGCTSANKKDAPATADEAGKTETAQAAQTATADEAAQTAPDFELDDLNGRPLRLSSLRGKYVVLDFWGSWCIWCIKGIPKMKEYYAKYADRMEILGIDCNDSEEKWKAAVKEHDLPWKHVYHPREARVLATYGIQGFPTKIVIDPEGKVVNAVVGEDPAFYAYLDELFK